MSHEPRVAVIGHGYWGKNITRVFAQSPQFQLHTVCDQSADVRDRVEKLYPHVATCADPAEISDEVEVIAIVTPTDTHHPLAMAALQRGCHVLVAKPFTRTLPQGEEVIALAREKGLTAFADYTFVFNPAVRKLREMLPRIGKPLFVLSQRLNLGLYQPDVGVIHDLLPHDLSILSFLFERGIEEANTSSFNAAGLPQSDLAHTSFSLGDDLNGLITVSWLSPYKVRQFFVVGSEGMLSYDDTEVTEKVKLLDRGISVEELASSQSVASYVSRISYRSGDLFAPAIPNTEALAFELEEFRRAIDDPQVRGEYERLNLDVMKSLQCVVDGQKQPQAAV